MKKYEFMAGLFFPSGTGDYYLNPPPEQSQGTLKSLRNLGEDGWHIVHAGERPNNNLFLVLEREQD